MSKVLFWILVSSIALFSLSFAFSQYISVKKHNLDIIAQMRLCSNEYGDNAQNCANAALRQKIGPYNK